MGEDPLAKPAHAGVRVQLNTLFASRIADVRLPAGCTVEDVAKDVLKTTKSRALVTLRARRCLESMEPRRMLQGPRNAACVADNLEHHGRRP